ncbi:hypothetical protein ACWGTI_29710 [Mesorhizobium sp. ArgA1]
MNLQSVYGELVFRQAGQLRHAGRIDMSRRSLPGFGIGLRQMEVVITATWNCWQVFGWPSLASVEFANPGQGTALFVAHFLTY